MKKFATVLQGMKITDVSSVDQGAGEGVHVVLVKRAADYDAFLKAKYSAEDRRNGAKEGWAMPDGSYPIKDAEDLHRAVRAVGRGKNNSHKAIRAHIKSRAKALGLEDTLPDTYAKAFTIAKRDMLGVGVTDGNFPAVMVTNSEASVLHKIGLLDQDNDDDESEDFNDVLEEKLSSDSLQQVWWRATDALYQSIWSILRDDSVPSKPASIAESIQQFAEYVGANLPAEIGKSLAAGTAAVAGAPGKTLQGEPMSEAIKKALGLPATATEADIVQAIEKAKKETEKADCMAKMSEKHKSYMDHPKAKMPEGGKDAFMRMSAEERDKHVKDNPVPSEDEEVEKALSAGEAFRTPEGVVVRKSAVGAEIFAVLKAQNDRSAAQAEEIRRANEDRAVAEFSKRATDAGLPADFGSTLRKAYSGDKPAQTELERVLKALRAQADEGKLFDTFGKNGDKPATAADEMLAKADEVKKAEPTLSSQQAYSKAYTDPANAEIVKRMKAEKATS